jgi:hypothetical protein
MGAQRAADYDPSSSKAASLKNAVRVGHCRQMNDNLNRIPIFQRSEKVTGGIFTVQKVWSRSMGRLVRFLISLACFPGGST